MKANINKPRHSRRKADPDSSQAGWDHVVDALAREICPIEEWQNYEQQKQQIAWQNANRAHNRQRLYQPTSVVRVFPVWRKYRQQALRVATLHQAVPLLRRLPLRFNCFLGELLFK